MLAVFVARLARRLARRLGHGGTSLPGLWALKIHPGLVGDLGRGLPRGSFLVTGTNGKTTTTSVAHRMLVVGGIRPVLNRTGANLLVGLAAALTAASDWKGRVGADLALLETDEATMPRAAKELGPNAVVVTNVFRDQLDRYGELSTTLGLIARGLDAMSPSGLAILNADDPQVAHLGHGRERVFYYGLELDEPDYAAAPGYEVADSARCPACGRPLAYTRRYYAHLGHYHCAACGLTRPRPHLAVTARRPESGVVTVVHDGEAVEIRFPLPGLYNLYNLTAASALALANAVRLADQAGAVRDLEPSFGRMEEVRGAGNGRTWIALVKNPVGFNQVLATIAERNQRVCVLLVLNDRYADGRDVSWIWDVNLEGLLPRLRVGHWWVSGTRAYDMALRLKYGGVPADAVTVVADTAEAVASILEEGGQAFILPTYTALLEVRARLAKAGRVAPLEEG